jgi:hypothetical protein
MNFKKLFIEYQNMVNHRQVCMMQLIQDYIIFFNMILNIQLLLIVIALCIRTGRIIYRNSSVAPTDLAITFEQEAVLSLKA